MMIDHPFLSKKRTRSQSNKNQKKMRKENNDCNIIRNKTIKFKSIPEKISTFIIVKGKNNTNLIKPNTIKDNTSNLLSVKYQSQSLFSILTHLEMKKAVFSYLKQREINNLISFIDNKHFKSMVLRSSNQIIKENLINIGQIKMFVNLSLQSNNSNNYYESFFRYFPSYIPYENAKYIIQIDDMTFYLETNTLHCIKEKEKVFTHQFSKEFITHIQLLDKKAHLLAVFCFSSIRIFDYEMNETQFLLPYSANYLLYNQNRNMFIITSDLSGKLFFHSHPKLYLDNQINVEFKLFSNGIEICELKPNKIVAYSIDEKDSNEIYIIDIFSLNKTILNETNENKLLLVSSVINYRNDWLVSADIRELIVWNTNTYVAEITICLNIMSVIRVNYLPEIRPDCFVVFSNNNNIKGQLVFIEAREDDRNFSFFNSIINKSNQIDNVYSISIDNKSGLNIKVFIIKKTQSKQNIRISEYTYLIPDKLETFPKK